MLSPCLAEEAEDAATLEKAPMATQREVRSLVSRS
jgi:hypothetical protein